MNYKHTQRADWLLGILFLFVLGNFYIIIEIAANLWFASLPIFVATLIMYVFSALTIRLDDKQISAKFRIPLVCKTVLLKNIESVKKVRNKWYYGFGIRIIPNGVLYNVSGLDGVEITIKGKDKKITFGTDEPDFLLRILKQKINQK